MKVYTLVREEGWFENNMFCEDKETIGIFLVEEIAEIAGEGLLSYDTDRMHHTSIVTYDVYTNLLLEDNMNELLFACMFNDLVTVTFVV